jgi:hypothetical protein
MIAEQGSGLIKNLSQPIKQGDLLKKQASKKGCQLAALF